MKKPMFVWTTIGIAVGSAISISFLALLPLVERFAASSGLHPGLSQKIAPHSWWSAVTLPILTFMFGAIVDYFKSQR